MNTVDPLLVGSAQFGYQIKKLLPYYACGKLEVKQAVLFTSMELMKPHHKMHHKVMQVALASTLAKIYGHSPIQLISST